MKKLRKAINKIETLKEYSKAKKILDDRFVIFMQNGIDLNDGTTDTDVHTEHCCAIHGCKYSDHDCSVVTRVNRQSFACLNTSVCYEMHPEYTYGY